MIGTTLHHYRILERVGGGGMGEVFLAEDLRLGRKVALKVLPDELTADSERRHRFVHEARAAAAIEHPHIAAVYDVDEVEGRTFIAMEYVRGQSLREVLRSRRLSVSEALELGVQVAEGLAKVHDHGIVHRDLKPENIIVSNEGYAKIIDFGLAKLLERKEPQEDAGSRPTKTDASFHTTEGVVMGTLGYMSPEQVRGEAVDARSDIFSFGVILYEMLSGHDPFLRESAIDTLTAILRDPPPRLRTAGRAPSSVHRMVAKALAKSASARYQKMKDLAADLREARRRLDSGRLGFRWLVASVSVAALVLAGAAWQLLRQRPPPAAPRPLSVLVADFDNRTGEAVFDGALEQAIGIGLEGAPFISAYGRAQARRQAGELEPGSGGRLDERRARLVCRSQGVEVLVTGSVARNPKGYLIEVRAVDPVTLEMLAGVSRQVKSKPEVLTAAANEVSGDLRNKLGDKPTAGAGALQAETFTTASVEAMNSYARAQELSPLGRYEEAIAEYSKAIAHDPSFGRAYAGLAVQLHNLGQRAEAEKHFRMALSRLDRMSERERHRTVGGYYVITRNSKAIEELRALVEKYPADNAGQANLALAYLYSGDTKRALEQGRRVVAANPRNLVQRNNVALYAVYAGEFEAAEREAQTVLAANPRFEKAYVALALAHLGRGRIDQAAETYRRLQAVSARGASLGTQGLADLALAQGQPGAALAVLDAPAGDGNAPPPVRHALLRAEAHLAAGERAQALAAAEQAGASTDEAVLFAVARLYLAAGDVARASRLAEELGGRTAPGAQAYGRLIEGERELRDGHGREAVAAFQQAQKLTDTWVGRFDLARAYVQAGQFVEGYSELQACRGRRGEGLAAFLDDYPTYRYLPGVHYFMGRAQEGLGSPAAAESYQTFLSMREGGVEDALTTDARRRLRAREATGAS